jgi:hypothetical protein
MSWPWRHKPLHELLAERGGLYEQEPPPHDTHPRWGETGIHGVARPREWDEVATVEIDLPGDSARFVVLPRTIVIEDGPDDVEPLADALELDPPYRAEAVRRSKRLWAVAARRIEVAELPDAPGDEIALTYRDGTRELIVDGERVFGSLPQLERLAARRGESYAAKATRVDGDVFEVQISPL